MTDLTQDVSSDDHRSAIEEVRSALSSTEEAIANDSGLPVLSKKAFKAVSDTEVDRLRERAKNERARGQKNLARRYDGVSSVMKTVALNERVTGSAFERFFFNVDNGIDVINRRGERFMGAAATIKFFTTLTERIDQLEADSKADYAAVSIQLDAAQRSDFIVPTYNNPASRIDVQIRNRLAMRILNVIIEQDAVLTTLQTLAWNGEVEEVQIEDQEIKIKESIRNIAKFITKTLSGMNKRVTVVETAAPAAEVATTQVEPRELAAA